LKASRQQQSSTRALYFQIETLNGYSLTLYQYFLHTSVTQAT